MLAITARGSSRASLRATGICLLLVLVACAPAALAPEAVPEHATDAELSARIDSYLIAQTQNQGFSGAVLIARRGHILVRKGYGLADRVSKRPNTADTIFRIASISKQFTAAAIMVLQAEGKLDVQDHACDYLAACPAAWKPISIHQLLTHTSGIPEFMELPDVAEWQATPAAPTDTMARFINLPLDFPPGSQFKYSNSGYHVLGIIVEQVSGQAFEAFVKTRILGPLGITHTGLLGEPPGLAVGYANSYDLAPASGCDPSVDFASGGIYSTVSDLYLFDLALLSDRLLPQDLRKAMLTPFEVMPNGGDLRYGYGNFMGQVRGHRMFGHTGRMEGCSSVNLYFPDDEVALILLSNQRQPGPYGFGLNNLAPMVLGAAR